MQALARKGGYGGDSTCQTLCSYSGSVDCFDSNEVDVSTMLMGCREVAEVKGL